MERKDTANSPSVPDNPNWSRSDWLGVIGIFIGAVGIVLAYYFYLDTRAIREPVFFVDPVRTEIIGSANLKGAPIRVIGRDGKEIKSDLSSIRFYFWNNGNAAIRKENILEPLSISLDDPRAKIIDSRLLKISRPVTQLALAGPARSGNLSLSFEILEKNDGTTGQLIYEGNPNAQARIVGVIEGASIKTSIEPLTRWSALKTAAIAIAPVVFGILVVIFVKVPFGEYISKIFDRLFNLLPNGIGCLLILIFLSFYFWLVGVQVKRDFQKIRDSSRPQSIVPESLRVAPSK